MSEQMLARLVIDVRLKREFVLQRISAHGRRASTDMIEQTFEVREGSPCVVAEDERNGTCPSPHRHVDDRVRLAEHVALFRELIVKNAIVAAGLEKIAIDGIVESLRCEMLEMHCLARIRSDAGRNKHKPREQLAAGRRRILRQKLPSFFR